MGNLKVNCNNSIWLSKCSMGSRLLPKKSLGPDVWGKPFFEALFDILDALELNYYFKMAHMLLFFFSSNLLYILVKLEHSNFVISFDMRCRQFKIINFYQKIVIFCNNKKQKWQKSVKVLIFRCNFCCDSELV